MKKNKITAGVLACAFVLTLSAMAQTKKAPEPAPAPTAAKVDLNTATEAELDKLPGIGPATAKKIMAGRPYSSAADLSRAGVSKRQIEQITPLVTVSAPPPASSGGGGGSANRSAPARSAAPAPSAGPAPGSANRAAPAPGSANGAAPAPGMVWVNTETKVYHKEGDAWYGKTKHGKYMTESEAQKAGFRAAKK